MTKKLQRGYRVMRGSVMLLVLGILLAFVPQIVFAVDENSTVSKASTSGSAANIGASKTIAPDLFTGAMSYEVPIDMPMGRHGMQPNLAIRYNSMGGYTWLGEKWDLVIASIERKKRPVDFNGDKYVYRSAGGEQDLVAMGAGEYRVKIEGAFLNFQKSANGWLVRDKSGRKYYFGQTVASQQNNPSDANKIFKWCLDRVEDTNGNYMTILYDKDYESGNNQLYPQQIDYAGHGSSLAPTNKVIFYTEYRNDVKIDYSTGFKVVTAKRLRTIRSQGNNNNFSAYNLLYQGSAVSGSSQLITVRRYGNDANVNSGGAISGGVTPQIWEIGYPNESVALNVVLSNTIDAPPFIDGTYPSTDIDGPAATKFGDFNGDGRVDVLKSNTGGGARLYLSNGAGFDAAIGAPGGLKYVSGKLFDTTKIADFNGDGKADILYQPYNEGGTIIFPLWIFYSNGNGFNNAIYGPTTLPSLSGDVFLNVARVKIGDFNGDGKCDILKINGYGSTEASTIYYLISANLPQLVGRYMSEVL